MTMALVESPPATATLFQITQRAICIGVSANSNLANISGRPVSTKNTAAMPEERTDERNELIKFTYGRSEFFKTAITQ
jgi:hypothetical protein